MASSSRTHEAFSSSSSKPWKYDVFLSFRGEDTRKSFVDYFYMTLKESGINAFIDENDLRRGENVSAELLQAIQGSSIAVIVFSRRYGDSSWCLEELVKIMECRTTLGQTVLPIFYDVDPSDVRKQTGSFGEAFHQKHKDVDKDMVQRWSDTLTEAANLSGYDLRTTADGHEAKFIRKIIGESITIKLTGTNLSVADYPVGIDSRLQDINYHLGVGSNDVRMVGIWGMGGLGKTTLAKAIYNQHRFQRKSFLADIRDFAKQPKGLVYFQEKLLYDILKTKIKVSSVDEGKTVIKEKLGCSRVLVIIDDVDQVHQVNAIVGNRDWFGSGSGIIITTRDEHLLEQLEVDTIYPAKPMDNGEALQLFRWHAFRNSCPNEGYFELTTSVVAYCGGLPLALKVFGSFLFERTITEWKSALKKLEAIPDHAHIQERLKISFDGLSEDGKNIFLDISCFFIGEDKNHVTERLDGCGFSAEIGIRVLLQRCLITISETNKLMMHDLLRDMGREIVRAKFPNDPGKWSRLWNPEDVTDVLIEKSGTEEIQGLDLSSLDHISTEAFVHMKRLRLLKLDFVNLTGDYKYLPNNLRVFIWRRCSLEVIPNDFNQQKLVVLELQYSKLIQVWEDSKLLGKLKILDLSNSKSLKQSPDFSKLPNLEKLNLTSCTKLCEIHQSIGNLKSLSWVNLEGSGIKDLPKNFYKLKSIETLVLDDCWGFENLDEDLGKMVSLTTLKAKNTAIKEVPSTIVRLTSLRHLSLGSWWRTYASLKLPLSLCGLSSLTYLFLSNRNLTDDTIPKDLGSLRSLEVLDLIGNIFHSLPSSLSSLSNLEKLDLSYCENLHEILDLPTNLEVLEADYCTALKRMPDFSKMSNMRKLSLDGCRKLIDIPGLDKSLNSMTEIHMEGCTNLTTTFMKNILQGWTSSGPGGISLPGNDIPEWFKDVGKGNTVSFEVPQNPGHNLKGLTLCVVINRDYRNCFYTYPICIANVSKRTHLQADLMNPRIEESDCRENHLWQSQISNDVLNLQGGDKVIIYFRTVRVKKTGVSLVWDKLMNEARGCGINPYNYSQFHSDSDWEEFISKRRNKRMLGDDEAGPSDDSCDVEDDDEDEDEDDDDDDDDDDDSHNNRMLGDDEAGPSHNSCDEDRPHKRLRHDPITVMSITDDDDEGRTKPSLEDEDEDGPFQRLGSNPSIHLFTDEQLTVDEGPPLHNLCTCLSLSCNLDHFCL